MNSSQPIAGVVLTLDEDHNLERALRSLAWCDELLVVDSGSTDQTHQVASSCGAQFLQRIQKQPFLITDQRNWALEHADLNSEWVLFLDADEEVSPGLADQITACIHSPAALDAYELTPRYWFLGKWLRRTQGYPNWHPRLLKRRSVRFQGGVWEAFSSSTPVGRLSHPYEHYAFSKGFDDWLERHRRYATWDADQIFSFLTDTVGDKTELYRKKRLRLLMSRLWFLRPPLRFLQKYIFQLGFLEGWQAFIYSLMIAFYDFMTVVKVIELIRIKHRLPL